MIHPFKILLTAMLLTILAFAVRPDLLCQSNDVSLVSSNLPAGSVVITNASGSNPVVSAAVAAASGNTLLLGLLPLLVPTIIFGVKAFCVKFLPKVPTWILPLAAPLIGFTADWITSLITGNPTSPIAAALLGLAGVGLREVGDQVKNRVKDGPTTIIESKAKESSEIKNGGD